VSTTAKLSPEDIAETAEVAREYLQGGYGRADAEQLAGDFAKVIVQVASSCVVGLPCDQHAGEVHGQEAVELRAGIEQILRNTEDVRVEDEPAVLASVRKSLVFLLDRVDARDSLAFRGAVDAVIGVEIVDKRVAPHKKPNTEA
jgi:hypothetical protein